MHKRLLLLPLAMWPLLAHADPKYGLTAIFYVVVALFLLAMPLVVAQVLGRLLWWLLGHRFNLWVLSIAALAGCWMGLYWPLSLNALGPVLKGAVPVTGGASAPSFPSLQYLIWSSIVAIILTALATVAAAFLDQKTQYHYLEQEE